MPPAVKPTKTNIMKHTALAILALSCLTFVGCDKDKDKPHGDLPPPPPPTLDGPLGNSIDGGPAGAKVCAGGGGDLSDPVSAPFFSKTVADYCIDPQGEVKTFGDKSKSPIEKVCTDAWDGGCQIYLDFGVARVVQLHYVDGAGKGGSVEVTLSRFKDEVGAYSMFTSRVVTDQHDAYDPSTPRPLAAGGAGGLGTGSAAVWRGSYFLEMTYSNENESPEKLTKSSNSILTAIAKDIGGKLPGPTTLPPAAAALPEASRIPNGILFKPKDVMTWKGVGPAAMGFYKDGDKRWRVLAIVKADADQAKDAFRTIKATPGSLPVNGQGDEAVHVVVPSGDKASTGPKIEAFVVRKGNAIWGITDEEYALREAKDQATARVSKEDAIARITTLLSGAPAGSPSSSSRKNALSPAASGTK